MVLAERQKLNGTHVGRAAGGSASAAPVLKCRVCGVVLGAEEEDDLVQCLCCSCKDRPEARRLGGQGRAPVDGALPPLEAAAQERVAAALAAGAKPHATAREFTVAEKALIVKVHAYMPATQLLASLNDRLMADLGPDALPYTMEQLHAEIATIAGASLLASMDAAGGIASGPAGWAALRKVVAQARRNGVLALIDETVINDFAVVFSLNSKQVLSLKDIVLKAKEDLQ